MSHWDEYLPEHWKEKLKKYALEISKGSREHLECTDFPNKIDIIFEDGSTCSFNDAFFLIDKEKEEICVFTEHCGYHIFYSEGLEVNQYIKKSKKYYTGKYFNYGE